MKKTKLKEKGITLIALVITIIVLIILATVSINMILNEDGGIIGAAEKSKELYQNAAAKEQTDLADIEELLGSYEEKWVYDSEAKTVTKGDVTLDIGQKVQYNEGTGHTTTPDTTRGVGSSYSSNTLSTKQYTNEDLEWRVLGVNEKGQLELISTNMTTDTLTLHGKAGFANLETKNGVRGTLDTFCYELYGQGMGAESARSLNLDDILAKFDSETKSTSAEYTFMYDSSTETVKKTNDSTKNLSEWMDTGYESITGIDWTVDSENVGPETLVGLNNNYYNIKNKITSTIEDGNILLSEFLAYGEGGSSSSDTKYQFIVSNYVDWVEDPTYPVMMGCWTLGNDQYSSLSGNDYLYWFYDSQDFTTGPHYVRPVVTLKLDTVVDKDGNIK